MEYLSNRPELIGIAWLLDIRRDPSVEDLAMAELIGDRGIPALVVITKADKVGRGKRSLRVRSISAAIDVPESQCLVTSARTKEGIDDLVASVEELVKETKEL